MSSLKMVTVAEPISPTPTVDVGTSLTVKAISCGPSSSSSIMVILKHSLASDCSPASKLGRKIVRKVFSVL